MPLVAYREGITVITHFLFDSQVDLGHQQHSGRRDKGGGGMIKWVGMGKENRDTKKAASYPGSFLCSKRKEHVYEARSRELRGVQREGKKERTGTRETSFRVRMYDDMICESHAPSPSYQFCCWYTLRPFVLPTGGTQYTSDGRLLALFQLYSLCLPFLWVSDHLYSLIAVLHATVL